MKKIYVPEFMLVLKYIRDNPNISLMKIHKDLDITYAHIHGIKKILVDKGWVEFNKPQEKFTKSESIITEKGEKVVEAVDSLLVAMEVINIKDVLRGSRKNKKKNKEYEIDIKDVEVEDEDN